MENSHFFHCNAMDHFLQFPVKEAVQGLSSAVCFFFFFRETHPYVQAVNELSELWFERGR